MNRPSAREQARSSAQASPEPAAAEMLLAGARSLLEAVPAAGLVLAADRNVIAANQRFVDEYARAGCAVEELLRRPLADLGGAIDESVLYHLAKAIPGTAARFEAITVWRKGDDARKLATLEICPASCSALLVLLAPASDAALLEQELRRADRLAGLGLVAAGFAHDLNNQLSAVLNIASLLKGELHDSEHGRALEILEGASLEAAALSRSLLAYTGRGEPELGECSLRQVVEDAHLLMRHAIPPKERVTVDAGEPGDAAVRVRGDVVQLQQIVVTLLLLGSAAARRGGSFRLTARSTGTGGSLADSASLPPGRYAILDLEHVPDPRATAAASGAPDTREMAYTGDLVSPPDRLALLRRLAAGFGGAVERIDENRLRVHLPLDGGLAPAHGRSSTGKRRRVLVVEDDAMVREVAGAMLERGGFEPVIAMNGGDAVELLAREDHGIDVVIVDLLAAGGRGLATLRALRDRNASVRVLVSSALPNCLQEVPKDLRVDGVLHKPYTIASLRTAIESVL